MLAIGDDGNYYLLSLNGLNPVPVPVEGGETRRLQFDRTWVPAVDHTLRTVRDLSAGLTYRKLAAGSPSNSPCGGSQSGARFEIEKGVAGRDAGGAITRDSPRSACTERWISGRPARPSPARRPAGDAPAAAARPGAAR